MCLGLCQKFFCRRKHSTWISAANWGSLICIISLLATLYLSLSYDSVSVHAHRFHHSRKIADSLQKNVTNGPQKRIVWKKIDVKTTPRIRINVTKVLLLSSNPRSGSSFTGELISAMPNVSYYFEPLWFFGPGNNKSQFETKMDFVSKLLNCHYSSLRKLLTKTRSRSFIIRKPEIPELNFRAMSLAKKREMMDSIELACHMNSFRIAKFFRLRLADILPIMSDPKSVLGQRFKIILLIRDPRAIINSVLKVPHEWTNLAPNPKIACTNIYNDITAFNRYEDLISNPEEMALKLYTFMGVPHRVGHAYKYLEDHRTNNGTLPEEFRSRYTSGNNEGPPSEEDLAKRREMDYYFNTYRDPKVFQHDHWRQELNSSQILDIETFPDCKSALELLGYE